MGLPEEAVEVGRVILFELEEGTVTTLVEEAGVVVLGVVTLTVLGLEVVLAGVLVVLAEEVVFPVAAGVEVVLVVAGLARTVWAGFAAALTVVVLAGALMARE